MNSRKGTNTVRKTLSIYIIYKNFVKLMKTTSASNCKIKKKLHNIYGKQSITNLHLHINIPGTSIHAYTLTKW